MNLVYSWNGVVKTVCNCECVGECDGAHPNKAGSAVKHPKYCLRGSVNTCNDSICPFNHFRTDEAYTRYKSNKDNNKDNKDNNTTTERFETSYARFYYSRNVNGRNISDKNINNKDMGNKNMSGDYEQIHTPLEKKKLTLGDFM